MFSERTNYSICCSQERLQQREAELRQRQRKEESAQEMYDYPSTWPGGTLGAERLLHMLNRELHMSPLHVARLLLAFPPTQWTEPRRRYAPIELAKRNAAHEETIRVHARVNLQLLGRDRYGHGDTQQHTDLQVVPCYALHGKFVHTHEMLHHAQTRTARARTDARGVTRPGGAADAASHSFAEKLDAPLELTHASTTAEVAAAEAFVAQAREMLRYARAHLCLAEEQLRSLLSAHRPIIAYRVEGCLDRAKGVRQ